MTNLEKAEVIFTMYSYKLGFACTCMLRSVMHHLFCHVSWKQGSTSVHRYFMVYIVSVILKCYQFLSFLGSLRYFIFIIEHNILNFVKLYSRQLILCFTALTIRHVEKVVCQYIPDEEI